MGKMLRRRLQGNVSLSLPIRKLFWRDAVDRFEGAGEVERVFEAEFVGDDFDEAVGAEE